MKSILLFTLFMFFGLSAKSQILEPVKWTYSSKRISKTTAVVYIKATIDKGWYIYSQTVQKGGPVKITIEFAPSNQFSLVGKTLGPKPISKYDKTFKMNVGYFQNTVTFQQTINLKTNSANVKGSVAFMTCDATRCIPEEIIDFSIPVKSI